VTAMRSSGRRGLALTACFIVLAAPLPMASAAPVSPQTYVDTSFSDEIVAAPTRTENQSKIWFHDNAWWALLVEPTGATVRVHELTKDHTWRPTSAVITDDVDNVGDALLAGNTTHVLSRNRDQSLHYVRLRYDEATRDYQADLPVLVTARGGSASAATLAMDGTGRLWAAFATVRRVLYSWTDDGRHWAPMEVLAETGTGGTPEQAAMVTFDDRVGVLWSDQATGSFSFAYHQDGADPAAWTREEALHGLAVADNHISLKRVPSEPSDTLVAAVKTSAGDHDEAPDTPLIRVLVRAPDGQWSEAPASTVAEDLNQPVLLVDEGTGKLHLFASGGGDIVTKETSLDDLRFEPGRGDLFVLGAGNTVTNATVPKEPVNARSGLVVLASDMANRTYRHAEMPLSSPIPVADPDDQTAPSAPGDLQGRALSDQRIVLTWSAATDGDQWAPARNGVPVKEYVVLRDGVEVATVPSTSIQDHVGGRPDDATGRSVDYAVLAVDFAGNRSEAVRLTVEVPAAGSTPPALVVGLVLAGLAAVVAGCLLWRWRRTRPAVPALPPDPAQREQVSAGDPTG
jgi:hypothetical protein